MERQYAAGAEARDRAWLVCHASIDVEWPRATDASASSLRIFGTINPKGVRGRRRVRGEKAAQRVVVKLGPLSSAIRARSASGKGSDASSARGAQRISCPIIGFGSPEKRHL